MSNRTFLRALMAYVAGGHLFTGQAKTKCRPARRIAERVNLR